MKLTRITIAALAAGLAGLLHAGPASAQTEDPINIFVFDARGAFISHDAAALPGALGVNEDQIPPRGLGLELGAHVYPIRGKSMALGLGASVLLTRAKKAPEVPEGEEPDPLDPTVQVKVMGFSPQVSLNFGTRRGYSYVSAGIGTMTRTIEAVEGVMPGEVTDDTRARTLHYGGGARWFAASHVAFTFDIRFYRVAGQQANGTSVSLPQQRLFVVSAGISIH